MIEKILNLEFERIGETLLSSTGQVSIYNISSQEQGLAFDVKRLFDFNAFFEKYNCTTLSISSAINPSLVELDLITKIDKINKLTFNSVNPIEIISSSEKSYFKGLKELQILGKSISSFPDLHEAKNLSKLTLPKNIESIKDKIDCGKIIDLHIMGYDDANLSPLAAFTRLERLRLDDHGKMASLDGLEKLPKLKTLHVASPIKLKNVDAIIRSSSIENIMFEDYKKIKDWEFLAAKKEFRCISLDTANSVDFISEFEMLEYFFCKKVINRDGESHFFSNKLHQDEMAHTGLKASYIPTCDKFYDPII
ncbi:hypothetical protein [Acidovorax sp. SUPP3334]|uniref:hypothetical protein n=1 Tax=Acidovorax sp. SUPP3334 TaxID=2920881 RepID=UPI0023DE3766|nr:hypothetical protein [Acidovorax sp. SUPP3334]GKT27040.1 hypothetical protein AVHM3334_22665 [Acidovorax sp. SUPP3334]